ncbi:MAG: two-component sensor histidine kinase [Planctomycetes bacterium]|nr:two-component sensor histidine kinase [Planctomycetota bacterium]
MPITALWILLGIAIGVVGMVPLIRLLLRRAENRARHAEGRARESERLAELGSMTGGLAHEINNPLSTVGLNAQLLAEGLRDADLPEDQRERLLRRLDALAREAERLRGILADFLQFAGRVKLAPRPVDLGQLIADLCDFFLPQSDRANVRLRMQIPDETVTIDLDEGLFKQALLNLMINAVQAMGNGAADDSSTPARDLILRLDADADEARVHVIDTGPGIDDEELARIFRPYVSSRSGGTGLGLPTSRRIVEEHGGRLTVHSDVGRGSEFVIHLPRAVQLQV